MKARRWLVSLYPRAWRQRYGDEFDALLDECLHSPLDIVDILFGALDAHMDLYHGLTWRLMNMVNKLRTTILMVFTAYICFVIGGLSFYGLIDDSPAATLMKTNSALSTSWRLVQIGAAVSFLAIVVGGLPLAIIVIQRAFTSSRRDLRWLLVPAFSFLAFIFYVLLLAALSKGWLHIAGVAPAVSPDNFPVGNRLLIAGLMAVFVLGAVVSTMAVWKIITNTGVEETTLSVLGKTASVQVYEYAYPLAVITTLGMLLMVIATLFFGQLSFSALPDWSAGNYGLLLTSTMASYGTTIVIMLISTAVAIFGLARGFSYRKTRAAA